MQLVSIDRSGIEACYQAGMVKPNEFRQMFMNILQKELQLRLEAASFSDSFKSIFTKENYFVKLYQDLSDCKEDVAQCIMNLAASEPEKLLIDEADSRKLFLSHVFYRKALLVRDCSDIFKHELSTSSTILVDKETLRAIEYLSTHSAGGKDLLRAYYEN